MKMPDFPEPSRGRPAMAMTIVFIIMFFGILIGGHLYGRYLASFHSTRTENTIAELRAETQKETRRSNSLSAELTAMEAKLEGAQAALDSIMPAPNTYTIYPNLTRIVGDGHLMVGMVGPPGNDAIMLNVNGKQQPLAAGQTINVAPDPATQCQLSVQSFDVFKATLVAVCSGPKAKH
jgi:hypothetical protein